MNVSSGQQIEIGKNRVIAESEIPLLRTTVAGLADKRSDTDADSAEQLSTAMLHDSLDALVRLLERVRPGMRGSILLLESDGVTLRHGAAPRLPADYCAAIDGAHIGLKAGSCGTAAYRRERVIVRDIATDPLWADYRTLAETHGLVACWSTPIFDSDGTVLGTFAMYPDKPVEPTGDDLSLTEMATLLAKNIIKRARAATALGERGKVPRGGRIHPRPGLDGKTGWLSRFRDEPNREILRPSRQYVTGHRLARCRASGRRTARD